MSSACDVAIIGAGAAGLAAAIFTAETCPGATIVALDGAAKIGAKILVSGGGRCNVTHFQVTAADYAGPPAHLVRHVLAAFPVDRTIAWFESLGVTLKRESTGKLFPVTDKAQTVLGALLDRCRALGVTILTKHRVGDIVPRPEGGFRIVHSQGEFSTGRVIMATGGRSLPLTGSDGGGWEIVTRLGHTVTPTCPALAPLVLDASMFHRDVTGLACDVTLSVFADGKQIDRRDGALLWTHFGVSGPVVMDASRHLLRARLLGQLATLRANLLPGKDFAAAEAWLKETATASPRQSLARTLGRHFPARLADVLAIHAGLDPAESLAQLSRDGRRRLVRTLVELELPVVRDRGWNYAEATAGGVPIQEVDHRTMASRKVPGLYLIGEMLDCDGRIGGFNFQWAWATAHIAGRAIGRR